MRYITILSIISLLKRRVQRLWRLIYHLLTMAMLVGLLMGDKDPSKVWNRRVVESRIVLLLNINVNKTLILGLPRKQNGCPIGYITLLSVISALKRRVRRLWRLIYGLLMIAMLVGPLMGVKDPGKVQNRRVAKSRIFLLIILVKTFIPRQFICGCRYCCINNANELSLLVSSAFWVKKQLTGGQISSKNNSIRVRTSVFVSSSQPLHHTDDWITLF